MANEIEMAIKAVLNVLAAAGAVRHPDIDPMREALRYLAKAIIKEAARKAIEP